MDVSEPQPTTKPNSTATKSMLNSDEIEKNFSASERSQPGRWLHMDVVEKEKMEWMTDVPLYPRSDGPSPSGEGEKPREVRFSLDGLVISRSVVLPVHLGLHHHGDEPQVSLGNTCTCTCTMSYILVRCRACTDVPVHVPVGIQHVHVHVAA